MADPRTFGWGEAATQAEWARPERSAGARPTEELATG
jgi:hypothetical protein